MNIKVEIVLQPLILRRRQANAHTYQGESTKRNKQEIQKGSGQDQAD